MIFYINNYKGFCKTAICLKEVNFLVGENNTGKTTVIKTLNTLIANNFFFDTAIGTPIPDLGNFDDIVSSTSADKSYFELGYCDEKMAQQAEGEVGAILIRFERMGQSACIRNIRYIANSLDVEVQAEKKMSYRYHPLAPDFGKALNLMTFFEVWAGAKSLSGDFVAVKQYNFLRHNTVYAAKYVVNSEILAAPKLKKHIHYRQKISEMGLQWIASKRARPKSRYKREVIVHTPYGENMPQLIRQLIDQSANSEKDAKLLDILNNFGQSSKLFDRIEVSNTSADGSSFELSVIIDGHSYTLNNAGYGVSQILPVIAEILTATDNFWLAIQEPEVYLHPLARKAFGEFIFEANMARNINFIIETHSPLIVSHFLSQMEKTPSDDAQLIMFRRNKECIKAEYVNFTNKGKSVGKVAHDADYFTNWDIAKKSAK